MNRLFSTRDPDVIVQYPEAKAINVLTLIDRLNERELEGVRRHYDIMSELCHPNSLGHRLTYGEFDANTGLTVYRDGGWSSDHLHSLFATMVLLMILDDLFEHLDARIEEIASLQSG
jgi:hypothetical protein